ncbi:amino acid ABC transporter permease [uncultured Thalassospira sp.]|jgi:general L-amino acid transport system permease protein|uniref:amino acid ABC transporter permease n=1 Tax=uncultured Thalassospira sp. TaxID=404382 RepID=UPI0030DAE3FC|tara:strand:- start:20766 stop:21869 length:1104 start_codon:yes stop_codon:yes gene_type:complete
MANSLKLPPGPIGSVGQRSVIWVRKNLFNSWLNSILTLLSFAFVLWVLPPIIEWAVVNSTFTPTIEACRATTGACWGFVNANLRLILFGVYPFDQQWRPLLAMIVLFGIIIASLAGVKYPRLQKMIIPMWVVGIPVIAILMWGGMLGLTYVQNSAWGGLPLTLILSTIGIVFAFPLGLLLALGRQSNMPAIKTLSVVYIEVIRGVPLITVLFMASVMFPLFLPDGVSIDKLLRAQIGIILFTAAYLAEVFRGGLQAVPRGQFEAGDSLGLSYWQSMRLIILPQALRLVIPPTVNSFISMLKDTTLVVIIGLFDLLGSVKLALRSDPAWTKYYVEGYAFAAAIFFLICFSMARYSAYLEKELRKGERR